MHIYDELYVISDTHIGGEKTPASNFQVFDRGERLSMFIRHITDTNNDNEVGLVINGDMIDSLAEPDIAGYVALDEHSAIKMMNRLYDDESFVEVWNSLAYFLSSEKRYLILLLGNHDIELALPVVERSMRERLAGDSASAQSRLHFFTHGTGYRCAVGNAQVYCTHGNEYDDWNWVDQQKLSQLANAMSSGRHVESADWKPNAGTRMVVDVMNHVKSKYPFVDVLKPEKAAVAAVLLVLDRDLFKKVDLKDAFPIFKSRLRGGAMTSRVLSVENIALETTEVESPELEDLLGPNMRELLKGKQEESDLLQQAVESLDEELAPVEDGRIEVLGAGDIIAGKLGLVSKPEALRRGLKDWIIGDGSFNPLYQDDSLFKQLQTKVGSNINFVITGHTHLCRSLSMSSGAHYFNTGTWIRLLKFTNASIDDRKTFESDIWPALTSGKMADLDQLEIADDDGGKTSLRFDRTNAVHIQTNGGAASGVLLRIEGGEGKPLKLTTESDTETVELN